MTVVPLPTCTVNPDPTRILFNLVNNILPEVASDIRYADPTPNTLWTSNGSGVLSSVNTGFGDAMELISTQTASTSASVSFTSGLTSTYKEYVFEFIDIHPSATSAEFKFQVNASDDTGGGFDTSLIASSHFYVAHNESGGNEGPSYQGSYDVANAASFQPFGENVGGENDESLAGELHLFNPASTTYVKNFHARVHHYRSDNRALTGFTAGYINDTTAIVEVQFKMSTGTFDGKIKLYGIK